MARTKTIGQRIRRLVSGTRVVVDEAEQARQIDRLRAPTAEWRVKAADALAAYPTDVAGAALADAVRDREVSVRVAAARSIRTIAAEARVPVTPVMDALVGHRRGCRARGH
jgi:hypothetical protein